jgi:hypothetical protein
MTVLAVVKDVCAAVGVSIPTSLFSGLATNRTMQEMVSLANEVAQRIAFDTREWTDLKKIQIYTGDGVLAAPPPVGDGLMHGTIAFNLPADYRRLLLNSNVWRSTSALTPMLFVPNTDEWLQRRAQGIFSVGGEWTIIGGQMLIWPVMGVGVTATYAYLQRNSVALSSGGFGDSFLNDTDSFVLDERLLKLGMIWSWKAAKGSPYAEDMATYNDALAFAMGSDAPAPILMRQGVKSQVITSGIAYPFPVQTP